VRVFRMSAQRRAFTAQEFGAHCVLNRNMSVREAERFINIREGDVSIMVEGQGSLQPLDGTSRSSIQRAVHEVQTYGFITENGSTTRFERPERRTFSAEEIDMLKRTEQ